LLVVALPDEVPDKVPDDVAPAAFPAAAPVALREEAFGEDCVLCGEQKFQVGNNKLATTAIKIS
jgi:hypothetical protein